MRRFSIQRLMGLVFVMAVAFAALRNADHWWAGGLLLAMLLLFDYSILVVVLSPGGSRATWLGFLVMGGGYFLAIRSLPEPDGGWMPTSQALKYLQVRAIGDGLYSVEAFPSGSRAFAPSASPYQRGPWEFEIMGTSDEVTTIVRSNGRADALAIPFRFLLPGVVNVAAFKSIGHSLFALGFGWLGAIVASLMWERRERREGLGPAGGA